MIYLLSRLIVLPFKIVFGVIRLALAIVALGVRIGRALGLIPFALGVAVGVLVAPGPGREMRERLRRRIEDLRPVDDATLADRVRYQLAHAPRTWHLAQPEVSVTGGIVTLTGAVPDTAARADLLETAAEVPGVRGVEDRLTVTGADSGEVGDRAVGEAAVGEAVGAEAPEGADGSVGEAAS